MLASTYPSPPKGTRAPREMDDSMAKAGKAIMSQEHLIMPEKKGCSNNDWRHVKLSQKPVEGDSTSQIQDNWRIKVNNVSKGS